MQLKITLYCPDCQSTNVKKNGRKPSRKQNYLCKDCGRQFIGGHALKYKGCHSSLTQKILPMPVRGVGIRDISVIEWIGIKKVLSVPVNSSRLITPQKRHYDSLEVDGFWTYAGNRKHKVWLIYACHRESGETVACVWGKCNYKTAGRLRDRIQSRGIDCDTVYTDKRDRFISVFQSDNHITGKDGTKGMEGNNCRLRHRIRRSFRKTCRFSKKLFNHLKAFNLVFYYINFGFVQ